MSNTVPAYNNTTSSVEPSSFNVPPTIPAESAELSGAGLPAGSHRYIVGMDANPAALADKIVGSNPRLQGAQAHYMANLAKNYGALKPGMIVEVKPSEQIIGHQGPAALGRAARAYEALKQLQAETGTTRLSPRDQSRIDDEMRAIQNASARPAPTAKLAAAMPMANERSTVALSPRLTTQSALAAPHTRFGALAPRPSTSAVTGSQSIADFTVKAPTLLAAR